MSTSVIRQRMPQLPRPGEQVRWRDLAAAGAWHWIEIFGPGPFEVVRLVDHRDRGLAAGLMVRTLIGEREINEVWLAQVAQPASGRRPSADQ